MKLSACLYNVGSSNGDIFTQTQAQARANTSNLVDSPIISGLCFYPQYYYWANEGGPTPTVSNFGNVNWLKDAIDKTVTVIVRFTAEAGVDGGVLADTTFRIRGKTSNVIYATQFYSRLGYVGAVSYNFTLTFKQTNSENLALDVNFTIYDNRDWKFSQFNMEAFAL